MGMTPIGNTNITQTMTSMGLNPNTIAQQADLQNIQQLQQMLAMLEASQYQMGSQQFGQYGTMPPGAMVPYGMMPPSTAFNFSQPYLGQSYYGGPSPYGQYSAGPQMQWPNTSQSINALQGALGMMQAQAGAYGTFPTGAPGTASPYGAGGMGNIPGATGIMPPYSSGGGPGGGFGGYLGLQSTPPPQFIPGEDPAAYNQAYQAWQNSQAQEAVGNYASALQLQSQLYSALHQLNQAIIQNIR